MKKIFFFTMIVLGIYACTKPKNELRASNTYEFFKGEWQAKQLVVVFHGVYNGDKDSVLYVKEGEFKSKLRCRPNTMTFNPDFTYTEIFYDTAGNELLTNQGNWGTNFDTLKLDQVKPYANVTNYKFTPNVDTLNNPLGVNLYRIVDFDFDGKEDDEVSIYLTPKSKETKSWWEDWFS